MAKYIHISENVNIRVEMEGRYEEAVDILNGDKAEYQEINPILEDIVDIIKTLEQNKGMTRAKIKEKH